jgi:hypothetical protein
LRIAVPGGVYAGIRRGLKRRPIVRNDADGAAWHNARMLLAGAGDQK